MAPQHGPWHRYPRTLEGAWYALDDLRYTIDEMLKSDDIATAVAAKMSAQKRVKFNTWEKIAGIAMAAAVISDFVVNLINSL